MVVNLGVERSFIDGAAQHRNAAPQWQVWRSSVWSSLVLPSSSGQPRPADPQPKTPVEDWHPPAVACDTPDMSILSIQSWVAYGRVGNRAAVFPLERLGHEVWPVNTVNFSNHPGYGSYRGGVYQPSDVAEVVDEIEARGAFQKCRAVLSGYLGASGTGDVVLRAVEKVRAKDDRVIFALDPVMGDSAKGLYVDPGLPEFFRSRALAKVDILLPNTFELGLLTGLDIADIDSAATAATLLLRRGPEMVVVTGLRHGGDISTLLVTGGQAWQATCRWVDAPSWGAGDLFSALFLGNFLDSADPKRSLGRAVASTYGILRATRESGSDSLTLPAAQAEIVDPSEAVTVLPVWAA